MKDNRIRGSNTTRYSLSQVKASDQEEMQSLNTPASEDDSHSNGIVLTDLSLSQNGKEPENKEAFSSNVVTNNDEHKPCEDFDEILEIVGSEGKFQKILLYGVLCPMVTISPFLTLSAIFMWDIPDHNCFVPGRGYNVSLEAWKNLTLPWEQGPDGLMRHSQCKMIDQMNGTETTCQFGWEYDKTDYESTVPSDYNWVCDKDHYATECYTYDGIGSAIGTVIFGILADKYGRKPIFFLTCFTNILFKTLSLYWAHDFFVFKILQLLGGLAFPTFFTMPSLISAEVSGTNYRSWIYAVTWMIWVLGNSLIPLVAWICREWFLFGWICAIPGFLLFLYYPIVHESPRWLITAGKGERATEIILKIAKANGKKVDLDVINRMVDELVQKCKKDAEKENVGVWTLFSKFRIAKNTIVLIISWIMNALLYYGITLNTTKMAGNKFLNYFYLSVIELPGGWLAGKLVETTGRRWTQAAFFSMCIFSCLLCAVAVAYGHAALVIIGALGIKFGVSVTSLVATLQGTEIFPTSLRSTGNGLASTLSSTIGTFGPYIVYTGTTHVSFPYAILGFCSLLGMLSSACLPETFKQSLPETVEDANKFGKGHKFWSYLPQEPEKGERAQEKKNSIVN